MGDWKASSGGEVVSGKCTARPEATEIHIVELPGGDAFGGGGVSEGTIECLQGKGLGKRHTYLMQLNSSQSI